MHLCIFEDRQVENFYPLTYLNPVFELWSGCSTLRAKLITLLKPSSVSLFTRTHLQDYLKECFPSFLINSLPSEDVLFVNGRAIADNSLLRFYRQTKGKESVAVSNGEVVAAYILKKNIKKYFPELKTGIFDSSVFSALPEVFIESSLIRYPWDLVHTNTGQIEYDFSILKSKRHSGATQGKVYKGSHLLNKKSILIGKGSVVKPGVVLDAEHGSIVIGNNVTIMPNAVIEGPAYIGDNSTIKIGAKIYPGTSIGAHCKIGGEVTRSIIQSYSNKAHDGFVGDSYIGSWVNLGADTNTSNLKNTYGNVSVMINGKPVDSGKQFVGLTMGDHSKSGINVMFFTGTVVGVSCNIFGAEIPPWYTPSFIWGGGNDLTTFTIDKSIEVARRMMERRGLIMSVTYEKLLRYVFTNTEHERKQWLKKY